MPSQLHEMLLGLFDSDLRLAPTLVSAVAPEALPEFDEIAKDETVLTDVDVTELRSDRILTLHRAGEHVGTLVVEVQLSIKPQKRASWPCYHVLAWRRHDVPAAVLVFTPSQAVADWATEPVKMGAGLTYQPIVVGPEGVPRIDDPSVARHVPELTLLSTMAHGNRRHSTPVLEACLTALGTLDAAQASLYYDVLLSRLNAAAKEVFHEMFNMRNYEYQSEYAREIYGRGQVETLRRVLKRQATLKFGQLSSTHKTLIEDAELEILEGWVERLLTAETANDLFESPSI